MIANILRNKDIRNTIVSKIPSKSKVKTMSSIHEAVFKESHKQPPTAHKQLSQKGRNGTTYTWYNGNTIYNNIPHGYGRRYYNQHTYYEGWFKNGLKHGKNGVFVSPKHIAIGTFKHDKLDGNAFILLRDSYRLLYPRPGNYYSVSSGSVEPKSKVKKNPRSWLIDRHNLPQWKTLHEADLASFISQSQIGLLLIKHVPDSLTNIAKGKLLSQ